MVSLETVIRASSDFVSKFIAKYDPGAEVESRIRADRSVVEAVYTWTDNTSAALNLIAHESFTGQIRVAWVFSIVEENAKGRVRAVSYSSEYYDQDESIEDFLPISNFFFKLRR